MARVCSTVLNEDTRNMHDGMACMQRSNSQLWMCDSQCARMQTKDKKTYSIHNKSRQVVGLLRARGEEFQYIGGGNSKRMLITSVDSGPAHHVESHLNRRSKDCGNGSAAVLVLLPHPSGCRCGDVDGPDWVLNRL
jgi:hypothetical protein